MAQLICNNLSLGYEGHKVIENVSFEVNSGDYLSIIGENGSGKSTLMKAILNLHSQLGGTIEFGDGVKANQIGYLPQQTDVQSDFPASVWEIVLSGCLNKSGLRPFYSKEHKALAKKNIDRMNISSLTKRCYRELSGGQQQRVLLARALCATEKILLLDEPVSGLDPQVTEEMYKLIKSLNDSGITIIVISHDMNAALEYSTHILNLGKSRFFGTKEEYLCKLKGGEQND